MSVRVGTKGKFGEIPVWEWTMEIEQPVHEYHVYPKYDQKFTCRKCKTVSFWYCDDDDRSYPAPAKYLAVKTKTRLVPEPDFGDMVPETYPICPQCRSEKIDSANIGTPHPRHEKQYVNLPTETSGTVFVTDASNVQPGDEMDFRLDEYDLGLSGRAIVTESEWLADSPYGPGWWVRWVGISAPEMTAQARWKPIQCA